MECQYALTTFGIPKQALPVSTSGEMFVDQHSRWIESRRRIEAQRMQLEIDQLLANGAIGDAPGVYSLGRLTPLEVVHSAYGENDTFHPNDVLFGRGRSVVGHEGNSRFRCLIAGYAEKFDKSSRLEKTQMTENIVLQIMASGGRFLKRDDAGEWEVVDHDSARKKVAHAFRNRRKVTQKEGC
jgi:hypothetical protein